MSGYPALLRNDQGGVFTFEPIARLVQAEDYEAMRQFYANRLQLTLAVSSHQSERSGITAERLQTLLRDES